MARFLGGPVPAWATRDKVIGYTGCRAIPMANVVAGTLPPGYSPHPTIYYQDGRLTVEHVGLADVGWKNDFRGGRCEFFGNVDLKFNVSQRPSQDDLDKLRKLLREGKLKSYFQGNQWTNVLNDGYGHLVEVWSMGPVAASHTSRNAFFWASTPLKSFLHQLAMSASAVAR